jgi:hypothetical protein
VIRSLLAFLAAAVVTAVIAVPASANVKACGSIHAQSTTFAVTVTHGNVRCETARRVLSNFLHGKSKMHGPARGPAYLQWWAVDGWKCGYGTGGGGCSRSHERILAQQG